MDTSAACHSLEYRLASSHLNRGRADASRLLILEWRAKAVADAFEVWAVHDLCKLFESAKRAGSTTTECRRHQEPYAVIGACMYLRVLEALLTVLVKVLESRQSRRIVSVSGRSTDPI